MRFKDIEFEGGIDITTEGVANYMVTPSEQLIDILNKIRQEKGNADLVSVNDDNDVYYNYYLEFDTNKGSITLIGVANQSEKDAWVNYEIPLQQIEIRWLTWKVMAELLKEIKIG